MDDEIAEKYINQLAEDISEIGIAVEKIDAANQIFLNDEYDALITLTEYDRNESGEDYAGFEVQALYGNTRDIESKLEREVFDRLDSGTINYEFNF